MSELRFEDGPVREVSVSPARRGFHLDKANAKLANGSFVCYLVRMVFITPVFWTHSGRGFDTLYFSLQHLSERPHQIFSGWLRRVLTTLLPLALVASVPAHALFAGLTPAALAETVAVTLALFLFVVWFWRRGLRSYSSASS